MTLQSVTGPFGLPQSEPSNRNIFRLDETAHSLRYGYALSSLVLAVTTWCYAHETVEHERSRLRLDAWRGAASFDDCYARLPVNPMQADRAHAVDHPHNMSIRGREPPSSIGSKAGVDAHIAQDARGATKSVDLVSCKAR